METKKSQLKPIMDAKIGHNIFVDQILANHADVLSIIQKCVRRVKSKLEVRTAAVSTSEPVDSQNMIDISAEAEMMMGVNDKTYPIRVDNRNLQKKRSKRERDAPVCIECIVHEGEISCLKRAHSNTNCHLNNERQQVIDSSVKKPNDLPRKSRTTCQGKGGTTCQGKGGTTYKEKAERLAKERRNDLPRKKLNDCQGKG